MPSRLAAYNGNSMQVVSDGKKLGLILPVQGTYIVENPIIRNVNIEYLYDHLMFSSGETFHDQRGVEINLSIFSSDVKFNPDAVKFIPSVEQMTVKQLFDEINKRLLKREGR